MQSDARPFQEVDTPEVTIGFDGHLLELRTKGVPSTEQGVTEAYGAIRSLTGGMVLPVLFDARGWPGGSPMAWMAAVHGFDRYFSVVAMLIDEETPEPRTRFPELVDRLLIPFKVFTDEAEALDFLSRSTPR